MKRPAFTFLELLIALSLFAVGMVSILQIVPANRKFITQSSMTTQATFLAEDQMEAIHGVAYSALTVLPTYYEPSATVSGTQFAAFTRKTEVVYVSPGSSWTIPVDQTTDTGLKKVKVTVSWAENGITRNYVLSTYVHK